MNFTQSTIFSIVASFGLLLINMFINVIESRVLGPTEIGRYQVFITTQTLFATFCALGMGQSCIYFINALKENERKVLATTVNSTIPIATIASLVLFVILVLSPDYFGREKIWCIALFCIGTEAMLINNIFTPVLLTKMEVVKNQIVKYSTRIFTLFALLVVLIWSNKLSVGVLLALTGFTNIMSMLLLYNYFSKRFSFRDGIDLALLGRILKWGIKLSGNNIASIILSSVPVYFLTWFSSDEGFLNVGYYSRANSLLVIGTVIASTIGPLLYSKWSLVKGEELKAQVIKVSMLFIIFNFAIAFGLILFAPLLIRILYGENYNAAIPVLQLLSLSLFGNGVKEVCYGVLSSQGVPIKILKNLTIGIIMSAGLCYIAIPLWGVIGCTVVTTLVTITTAFLLMWDVTKISSITMKDFFVTPSISEIRNIINIITNSIIHRK